MDEKVSSVTAEPFLPWLIRDQQWSRAGLPMAVVLSLLGLVLRPTFGLSRFLIFLHSPMYMLHQVEEHGHGAFKAQVVRMLPHAPGPDAPGVDETIFGVNIGVWSINLLAFALARGDRPGRGLIAPYVVVVNGSIHVLAALRQGRYNPGVWTGATLFLPVGGATLLQVTRAGQATRRDHVWGIGGAALMHALTLLAFRFLDKKQR